MNLLTGDYISIAASTISKIIPKVTIVFRMPCSAKLTYRVLQIIISAHCITTIPTKADD